MLEGVVSGKFLGDCGLTYQRVERNQLLEVGYHLLASHRGRRLVTESSRIVVDFGFDRLDVPLICSIVHRDNQASIAVARRIHDFERTFTREGGQARLLFWSEKRGASPANG